MISCFYLYRKDEIYLNIVILDGQGGRLGRMLVEQLKTSLPQAKITAIGTNSIATSAMLKAGADAGATGENPALVACRDAQLIIGPLGIVIADSLLGEITPAMAKAVGQSPAHKILIPINRCNNTVVGVGDLSYTDYVRLAVEEAIHFSSH